MKRDTVSEAKSLLEWDHMAIIAHGRQSHRTPMVVPCRISNCGNVVDGMTKDISWEGVAVSLLVAIPPGKNTPVRIWLREPIVITALPVHAHTDTESCTVGFQITRIETGEREWKRLTVASR